MQDEKTLASIFGQASILDVLFVSPKVLLKDLPKDERDAFIVVLENPDFSLEGLSKGDAYTDLFKIGDDEYLYERNPEAKKADVTHLTGPVGLIASCYHLEQTLRAHESLVTVQMDDNYLDSVKNADRVEKGETKTPITYILCGFLHDIGKKWCGQTNKDGEISSYGHAQCSAYVANQWLKKTQLVDSRTRKIIVAAIYGHDLIKKWNPDGPEKVEEYQELLREIFDDDDEANTKVRKLTEAIADADAGVTKIVYDGPREVEYELSWEHFSKDNGEIEEKKKEISADEYEKLLKRAVKIIADNFPQKS
ncbi:MAG: hypothetical protein K6G36_01035 [Candidatus Saccharibacteria bacterium]|nr:hypothetical protein [Candidatus Saccharibacteria bacterium]